MKKVVKIVILLTIFILLSSFSSYSEASEKRCIVFLVNRMSLEDIENMPLTKQIADEGALGLMNTRVEGSSNDYASTLTIGSGTRTKASYNTSRSEKIDEENISIYQRRTGYAVELNQIANLDIARLKEVNKTNNYNPIIGALGDSLKMNNIKISVIGNSDTDDIETRLGILMGMDENGIVEDGLVEGDINMKTPEYPFGIKTNYDLMTRKYKELSEASDTLILELGDLHRLEKYSANLSHESYVKLRKIILTNIDLFINNIYNLIDKKNTRIIILSPAPSVVASDIGKKLTPLILAGGEISEGVLSSDTTRREGIVTNIDVAPYISEYFNGDINFFTGKPIYILEKKEKFNYIRELDNYTSFIYKNRLGILFSFAIYEIIVSFLAFILIQAASKYKLKLSKRVLEYMLLSNMAIPIALLILPLIKASNIYEAFLKVIIMTVLITIIAIYLRKEAIDSIILLSGSMCILLTLDIIMGSRLIKMSFLGYDPIIGARYYGLGNEFMGILIGASLVFITALLDKYKFNKGYIIIFFISITTAIGFPKLGANVGGTITSASAFMFVILKLYNSKLKIIHYIYIIAAIFTVIFIISLVDLYFLEHSSHLANAIKNINNGGINVIYSIIKRKIAMNLKLFGITIWSKVLVSSLVFLSVLFYRPFGIVKKVFNKYNNISIGLFGILAACIVSFLVNDSGVVASATASIFLAMTLMYLVFNEIDGKF